MVIRTFCDCCGKEGNSLDVKTVKMLVSEFYDGDTIQLCVGCELKISNMWVKR